MAPTDAGFELGFQMHPLTTDGDLDTSLDNKGLPHAIEHDMLWKLASDNLEAGSKLVGETKWDQAIAKYSETIMQLRSLESETDVKWDDKARFKVRELRARSYLNLSLCFLKTEQWTHAVNTATRALQGDKTVPDPADNVLSNDKKAKALFRRATAHIEGFGSFDKGRDDLQQALDLAPNDKNVRDMWLKCSHAHKITSKKADKKIAGFLKKSEASGEGLFDDSLRPSPEQPKAQEGPAEPVKVRDGLWVYPQKEGEKKEEEELDGDVDLEELDKALKTIKSERPEAYANIREKVKTMAEEEARAREEAEAKESGEGPQPEKQAEDSPEPAQQAAES